MRYYTDTIPLPLAEKLKEKGMPLGSYVWMPNGMASRKDEANLAYFDDQLTPYCTYAEVFDWLMEKGWLAAIGREYDFANELVTERFEWGLEKVGCFSEHPEDGSGFCDTWHEAATEAIENALTLIQRL